MLIFKFLYKHCDFLQAILLALLAVLLHRFCVAESVEMSNNKMLNGYKLRRRFIPPQPLSKPKVVFPTSLININEPMKSKSLLEHFKARMEKTANKVSIYIYVVYFCSKFL